MLKRKMITIILVLLFFNIFNIFFYKSIIALDSPLKNADSIIVDKNGSGDYTNIQDAIDSSNDGDTIIIYDGNYSENILVNKELSIYGNGTENTRLIFQSNEYFYCNHEDINVANISIIVQRDYGTAISVYSSDNISLTNIEITSPYGISLGTSPNYQITNCKINSSLTGINIGVSCEDGIIEDNTIGMVESISGIITSSSRIQMKNNTLINCTFIPGFKDFTNIDIDTSNTINGYPIYQINERNNFTFPGVASLIIASNSNDLIHENYNNKSNLFSSYFSNCTRIEFNNNTYSPHRYIYTVNCYDTTNFFINNCNIYNSYSGFRFDQSSNIIIEKSCFTNVSIPITCLANDVEILKNSFIDSSIQISGQGTLLYGWRVNISDNKLFGSSTINVNDGRSEILIEGNEIDGTGESSGGITVRSSADVRILNNYISNCVTGINSQVGVYNYDYSSIMDNRIINCADGIRGSGICKIENNSIESSSENGAVITGRLDLFAHNIIINCTGPGILLSSSRSCNIYNNTVKNNSIGIKCDTSRDNVITHNYFIENPDQVITNGDDEWYRRPPIGGNYWSDYDGVDRKKGTQQDQYGSDGFGDTPYSLSSTQSDRYPLIIDLIKPISISGENKTIYEGTVVHFNGEQSTDNNMVINYEWKFKYGNELKVFTFSKFDFLFNIPGIYFVNLTVYDFSGNYDVATSKITVLDMDPPIVVSQGNITINQGELARFSSNESFDDGKIDRYLWFFTYDNNEILLEGENTEFIFDIPGLYKVEHKCIDKAGNSAIVEFFVNVMDTEKPTVIAGEDIVIENGETITLDGTNSYDNGILKSTYWLFEYDGQSIQLEQLQSKFTFITPGYYNITLKITDEYLNFAFDYIEITVIDTIDPEAIITGQIEYSEGAMVELSGQDSLDNGRIVKHQWNFNDNNNEIKIDGEILSYGFSTVGIISIKLTVFDEWNNTNSTWTIVIIEDIINPIAIGGNDVTIPIGSKYHFNGSMSTDNGKIVKWKWTFFYDGEMKEYDMEIFSFKFDIAGEYIISFYVYDEFDNYNSEQFTISVTNKGWVSGIIVDQEGNPIEGAKIVLIDQKGKDFSIISTLNGSFMIELDQSIFDWEISKEGYKTQSGTVQCRATESSEIGLIKLQYQDKKMNTIYIIILIIIIIILIMVALLMLYILRKKKQYGDFFSNITENLNGRNPKNINRLDTSFVKQNNEADDE